MAAYLATYRVEMHEPRLTAVEFASLVEQMVAIDMEEQVRQKSPSRDQVSVETFEPVSGPTAGSPARFVLRHVVNARVDSMTARRAELHLKELLDIPQPERANYRIVGLSVSD